MSDKKAPKTDEKALETTVTAASNAPVTNEKGPETTEKAPKAKFIKVKFLRTHPAFAVSTGEETEISQDDFDKYTQDGPFFERVHTR